MIPRDVVSEIKSVLSRHNGKRSIQYQSNFSTKAWDYVLKMSDAELFTILPPKTLSTKGKKVGQHSDKCKYCKAPTRFISYTVGYAQYCSTQCAQTMFVETETAEARTSRMKNTQATMLKLYGARCTAAAGLQDLSLMHTPKAAAKRRATKKDRFGTAQHRTKAQHMAHTVSMNKRSETWRKNRIENPESFKRNPYQRKSVSLGTKQFSVQGYEPQVLKALSEYGLDIATVTINPMCVEYIEHGKKRLYVPDFRAKIGNKWYIVEVKSTYTAGLLKTNKTLFYNLRRKSAAVKKLGNRICTALYEPKTHCVLLIDDIHEYSISEARELVNQNLLT